jgi:polyisoprenoid-binding protein YceI
MRTKTFGLILAVCFLTTGACFADPFKGTWKLDAAKSKLGKGTAKNNVVNYESEFPGLRTKVLIDGVDANGHAFHSSWEGRFDGQERPVTGDPMSDSRSYTKVNENTLDFTAKKAGQVVGHGRIVVAADEKTRTVTSWSTNPKGKQVKSVAVYNKE